MRVVSLRPLTGLSQFLIPVIINPHTTLNLILCSDSDSKDSSSAVVCSCIHHRRQSNGTHMTKTSCMNTSENASLSISLRPGVSV